MLIPFDDQALMDDERHTNTLTQHAVEGISLLKEITARLNKEGASQELAIMIESIDPEALPARYPRESFTQDPTPTNLTIAAESAVQAVLKAIHNASKAVIEFIVKLYRSIMDAISNLFDKVKRVAQGQKRAEEQEAKTNEVAADLDGSAIKDYNPDDGSYTLNDRVELKDGDYTLTLHYGLIKDALSPLVVAVFDRNITPGVLQQNVMAALRDARATNAIYEEFVDLVKEFNTSPTNDTLQSLVKWMRTEEMREHHHDIKPIASLVDHGDQIQDDLPNLVGHGLGSLIALLNQADKERYDGDANTDPIFKRLVRSRYDMSQLLSLIHI